MRKVEKEHAVQLRESDNGGIPCCEGFLTMPNALQSDQPVTTPSEDRLGRTLIATKIAETIAGWKPEEPLALAINGPWGSGKTSLLNLLADSLEPQKAKGLVLVRFEPWMISGHRQLVDVFLRQLMASMGELPDSKVAKKIAGAIDLFAGALTIASITPGLGGIFRITGGAVSRLGKSLSKKAEAREQDLVRLKKNVCDVLQSYEHKIVVMIDDIDRLDSKEIVEVVRLVRAVADFPNTVYVLAFDRNVVERAVEDFQVGSTVSYIDKLFQFSVDIPESAPEQCGRIALEQIQHIVDAHSMSDGERHRWNQFRFGVLPYAFASVRDAKRFANSFKFTNSMLGTEVNVVDQLCLEIIRLFNAETFRAIGLMRSDILSDDYHADRYGERKKRIERWIDSNKEAVREDHRAIVPEVLGIVFPEVSSVLTNVFHGHSRLDEWKRERRVCLRPFFYRYFQGLLPEGSVSAAELMTIKKSLQNRVALQAMLSDLVNRASIVEAMALIEYEFTSGKIEDLKSGTNLLAAVFETCESIPFGYKRPFDFPVDWFVTASLYSVVSSYPVAERAEVVLTAMNLVDRAVAFPVSLVEQLHSRPKDKDSKGEEPLVTESEMKEITEVCLRLINVRASDLSLLCVV